MNNKVRTRRDRDGGVPPGENTAADVDLILNNARRNACGYLSEHEVERLAQCDAGRLVSILVRCGDCRFIAAAAQVRTMVARLKIADRTFYVRDYSIPASVG